MIKSNEVAYLMAETEPDASELRNLARSRLPEYMVPTAWVTLDAFPLNTQGKVDREQLPAPDGDSTPARGSGFVAPRTEMETQVAAIWKDVLEVERVGVHDNFFDLGGHSLLLMKVIGALEKQMGLKLNPGELVLPTLGQLAALCEARKNQPAGSKPRGLIKRLARVFRGQSSDPGDMPSGTSS